MADPTSIPAAPQPDHAELVILSLLEGGAMYGYAISKEVAARSDQQLRLTPGVLYPILKRLESEGLIASSWDEVKSDRNDGSTDGRKRKWYRLSAKGRRRLAQRVAAHRAWRSIIDLFLPPTPRTLSERGGAAEETGGRA